MKKFIVTEEQLREYIEKKKAQKVFDKILESMYLHTKHLLIPAKDAKNAVLEEFRRKNQITPKVEELLKEHNLLEDNTKVL